MPACGISLSRRGSSRGLSLEQLCGAESALLLSVALVLISTIPWTEVWFEGVDRLAVWHRRLALVGLVLLIPHVALSKSGPDATGVPFAVVGTYAAIGGIGLAFYAYRELLARHFLPFHDYEVEAVRAARRRSDRDHTPTARQAADV
jgi:hypothetical protein